VPVADPARGAGAGARQRAVGGGLSEDVRRASRARRALRNRIVADVRSKHAGRRRARRSDSGSRTSAYRVHLLPLEHRPHAVGRPAVEGASAGRPRAARRPRNHGRQRLDVAASGRRLRGDRRRGTDLRRLADGARRAMLADDDRRGPASRDSEHRRPARSRHDRDADVSQAVAAPERDFVTVPVRHPRRRRRTNAAARDHSRLRLQVQVLLLPEKLRRSVLRRRGKDRRQPAARARSRRDGSTCGTRAIAARRKSCCSIRR